MIDELCFILLCPLKKPETHITKTTNFFQKCFAQCLVVPAFKASNDLDKYLPRHSVYKDCLESEVHHNDITNFINFDWFVM